jgi:hypothetical protein
MRSDSNRMARVGSLLGSSHANAGYRVWVVVDRSGMHGATCESPGQLYATGPCKKRRGRWQGHRRLTFQLKVKHPSQRF